MDYILHLIIVLCLSGVLTLSLNYVAGFGGIISLSHMTFYGVGAYTTAIFLLNYNLPFLLAAFLAVMVTGLIAFLVSFPILKLRGDSLILVSLGFAIIAYNVLLNVRSVTRGALGISQIPNPEIFGILINTKVEFLVLSVLVFLFTAFVLWWVTRSMYGVVVKSIREEETKALTVGYFAQGYLRSIFVFGALFAGLAGSLFATYFTIIEPKSFDIMPSVILLIMVILGGLGDLKGAILGALFMVSVPEILRFVGLPNSVMAQLQQVIYGLFVVLLMFWRPQGLLGKYKI